MSLTDAQIIDVALRVNRPDFVEFLEPVTNSQIVDVALTVNSLGSVDLLDITTPTVNIIAVNTGPRGPQGESGQWEAMTQSEYDALNPPDPDTLYIIIQ